MADTDDEASDLSPRAGNHKEVHYHNGTSKIVWAYAGMATVVLVGIVGFYASSQAARNETVTEVLSDVRERLAAVEAKLGSIESAVERQQ